jgi:hypothetical protein
MPIFKKIETGRAGKMPFFDVKWLQRFFSKKIQQKFYFFFEKLSFWKF